MPTSFPRATFVLAAPPPKRSQVSYIAAALAFVCLAVAAPTSAAPGEGSTKPHVAKPPPHAALNGYWRVTNFVTHDKPVDQRITHTLEGDLPPLRPEAQAVYDKRIADQRNGTVTGDTDALCIGPGVPRMMRGPGYPFYISQPPGMVVFNFEILHNVRWVYLNAKHPKGDDLENTWQGDSTAKWEGDTLVVDTVGLTKRNTIDKVGLPASDDLHVVEHIRMTGPDAFEDLITIDDPKTYTHPWNVKATYGRMPPGTRIDEYVCENNRNAPGANGANTFDTKK
jgi:hypothetical protein